MDFTGIVLSALLIAPIQDDGLHSILVKPPNATTATRQEPPEQGREATQAGATQALWAETAQNPARESAALISGSMSANQRIAALLQSAPVPETTATKLRLNAAVAAAAPARREEAVAAYWELSRRHALVTAAKRHKLRLSRLLDHPLDPVGNSLVQAALREADANLQALELSAEQSAARLATILGQSVGGQTIPVSIPHAGGYDARFQELFANRQPPAEIRLLNGRFPRMRDLLEARSLCIEAADDSLAALKTALDQETATVSDCIAGAQRLLGHEQEFLNDVYDYNNDIASYAMIIGGDQPADVFVGMLIKDRVIDFSDRSDVANRVVPAGGSDGFRPARSSEGGTATADGAPRAFIPPRQATPLRSNEKVDEDGLSGASEGTAGEANSRQQGWEAVPGYRRDGQSGGEQGGGGGGQQGSTSDQGIERDRSNFRPLSQRYRANYRGEFSSPAGQPLEERLQHLPPMHTGDSRAISLCEAWELATVADRPRAVAAYWQACLAAAQMQLQLDWQAQLLARQTQMIPLERQPHRGTDMLLCRLALRECEAEIASDQLSWHMACHELSEFIGAGGGNAIFSPAPPEFGQTELENQLASGGLTSWDLTPRIEPWRALIASAEETVALADEELLRGARISAWLEAGQRHNASLRRGLQELIALRTRIAALVAVHVEPAEQCSALVNPRRGK